MPRIEIELTSDKGDGTWTWRAAGARQPKGSLENSVLPSGAKVGDILTADSKQDIDGILITSVQAPKAKKEDTTQTLEILGSRRDQPLVTSNLVRQKGGKSRKGGRDRDRGRSREKNRDRKDRPDRHDEKSGRGDRSRGRGDRDRDQTSHEPEHPKRKRLKAGRQNRNEALKSLPDLQQPMARLLLQRGIQGVRDAVNEQHSEARSSGQPMIDSEPLLGLAEKLLPGLRAAEWRDRAEAAQQSMSDVDLRDLRSVVVAGESFARDDESRKLVSDLRDGLTARVEAEHREWLDELNNLVNEGRIVRALKVSSRPPKAGSPLPADLAAKLAEQATAALTDDISQDRFVVVLDAVSFSPIRQRVAAKSIPAKPSQELMKAVKKVASKVPAIAQQFGVAKTP